ncbi:hypothetical protein DXG01_009918 [Tephrocybe rancida]|nr:hypothetical protein DXG01_009918 [Tephrocybe rancida]
MDDPDHDPYAATRGIFYSHVGWIFFKPTYERLENVDRGDLIADPVVRYQHKYYVPMAILCGFILPTVVGVAWGDPTGSFIWGGLAHWDGLQPYSDENTSRGSLHAFPHDFRSGPSLIDWDPSKWIIITLHRMGLVTCLRRAKERDLVEAINYMRLKTRTEGHSQQEDDSDVWEGELWDSNILSAYIQARPGRCVIEIDGFAVDATAYLAEHTRNEDSRQETRMSKRELGQLNGATEIEGPRNKRRRETAAASMDVDVVHADPTIEGEAEGVESGAKKEDVQELGLKLFATVKDAVNKEGRALSLVFQRRPSKRQYPDYYTIIQQPIALEDIKKRLDNGSYPTLSAVKQDFELCFSNAKQYNMKGSDIWRDAKDLLKLVNKTYNKLVPPTENGENGDGEGKKHKSPNLSRLIKTRLQKLIGKTDESGRALSKEFMELPSKKDWPDYYRQIKRPQCLETIFKHIKRKEYATSNDFADDVELVFNNAMAFNQEHTGIWEDARALRDYFRVLVADLPPPFELPQYALAKPKIKIKPQAAQNSVSLTIPSATQPTASTSQTLRIPAVKQIKASPASTPATTAVSLPSPAPVPAPATTSAPTPQAPAVPVSVQPTAIGTPQPVSYLNTTFSHYPNASYIPPVPTPVAPTAPTSTSNLPTNPVVQALSASNSPAPPLPLNHQLKSVTLTAQPRGRTLGLDYEDGVKCWAMRLVPGETEVHVNQVTFLGDEDDESSGEEEEQEQEEEEDAEVPAANGRKKGRGRGRGRPKATLKAKGKAAIVKKKKQKIGPVQVKLNGVIVKEQEEESGQWIVSPAAGSNTIEVGESGGLIWKIYVQRMD